MHLTYLGTGVLAQSLQISRAQSIEPGYLIPNYQYLWKSGKKYYALFIKLCQLVPAFRITQELLCGFNTNCKVSLQKGKQMGRIVLNFSNLFVSNKVNEFYSFLFGGTCETRTVSLELSSLDI